MTKSTRRVHDRTGGPATFKTKVVLEALKGVKTLAQLHRQPGQSDFGIHAQQITDWKRQVLDGMPTLFESATAKPGCTAEQREQLEGPLFQQIGQLKVENERSGVPVAQKKIAYQLGSDRNYLIEPAHPQLSISQQCSLLNISRSSYYYQPVGESATNLALMLRIDKLFTDRPEMGVRRMHQELTNEAEPLNVKRIRRLVRLMGLEAVGLKLDLSKPQPGHTIYPYLLRGVSIERVNQVWSTAQAAL